MKKHAFSLIEISVALAMAALVIGILLTTYIQNAKLKKKVDVYAYEVLKNKKIQETLTQMFSEIDESHPLTCDEKALTFVYDHKIDPETAFCGPAQAAISLKNAELILTISPLHSPDTQRCCILTGDVHTLDWAFISSDQNMLSSWTDKTHLPEAIRMQINGDLAFAFFPKTPNVLLKQ